MQRLYIILTGLIMSCSSAVAQQFFGSEPFAHTYSIVARDSITGEMGVAVQSHWFSVGTIVSWGEAGVGVVATQSFVNPALGPDGLAMMATGIAAPLVLDSLLKADEGRAVRQVAMLDAKGQVKSYTGAKCIQAAGHHIGKQYAVQANMMRNSTVWKAMSKAYEEAEGPLAERLLLALEAAEAAGGDIRGRQSAALLVVKAEASGKIWEDRQVDIQIADHADPLGELRRILKVHRAYERMNAGDLAVEDGNMELAMEHYAAAEEMFPENLEMQYWHAVTLANTGEVEQALPLFKAVFTADSAWRKLTTRLVPVGLLEVSQEDLKRILGL